MLLLKTAITSALLFLTFSCFSQELSTPGCSIMKSGKFRYLDAEDPTAFIIIDGENQTEYSERNNYIIESKLTSVNECSYIMKMTKVTVPNFPFQPGDKMKVEITKVEGDIIYYTSTVKGQSWKGRFRKISKD